MLVLGFLIPCLLSSVLVANSKANAILAITHIQFYTHDFVLFKAICNLNLWTFT